MELDLTHTTNEDVLKALRELFDCGQLSAADLYKGVVGVAADYACNGEILLALTTLAIPPKEYFEYIQIKQMQEDNNYATVAEGLAARLMRYGLDGDMAIIPTQKAANA